VKCYTFHQSLNLSICSSDFIPLFPTVLMIDTTGWYYSGWDVHCSIGKFLWFFGDTTVGCLIHQILCIFSRIPGWIPMKIHQIGISSLRKIRPPIYPDNSNHIPMVNVNHKITNDPSSYWHILNDSHWYIFILALNHGWYY
jgi:hypothetical protein